MFNLAGILVGVNFYESQPKTYTHILLVYVFFHFVIFVKQNGESVPNTSDHDESRTPLDELQASLIWVVFRIIQLQMYTHNIWTMHIVVPVLVVEETDRHLGHQDIGLCNSHYQPVK